MTIIVDTREQNPYFYDKQGNPDFDMIIKSTGLKTGDYSIENFSDPDQHPQTICVERKNPDDLFQSMGRDRDRFTREIARMSRFTFPALVIEIDYGGIFVDPPPLTRMSPKSVFRSIITFTQRYRIHCFPCPGRQFAERTTYLLLRRFYDDRQPGGPCNFEGI